jgi:hypothetical protein
MRLLPKTDETMNLLAEYSSLLKTDETTFMLWTWYCVTGGTQIVLDIMGMMDWSIKAKEKEMPLAQLIPLVTQSVVLLTMLHSSSFSHNIVSIFYSFLMFDLLWIGTINNAVSFKKFYTNVFLISGKMVKWLGQYRSMWHDAYILQSLFIVKMRSKFAVSSQDSTFRKILLQAIIYNWDVIYIEP